ncbi:transporter [Undibacterium sp. Jales W-56]|uniref:transporter n=1 Tax=Undibacterium sp. Jales W-56 TaxID=2897325 RepID=UPI0021CFE486|nr:transporter [Undibacterium sp. Jales W-56]MCU6432817.1 transporter [Undibacterium sp. Jales W-56]
MSFLQWMSAISLAGVSLMAIADDDSGITPYRPSVSSPAQLPLAGQVELEMGLLSSKQGDSRRDSLPYQLKLAFNPQWGILIGGEAAVSARDDSGNRARGLGDTTLVLKRAFLIDDSRALGLEFGIKVPTAKDTIGSGKADYSINGIYSQDIGKVHMDANLNFVHLGIADPDTSSTQTGLSASFSTPISEKWSATAELSGTRRSGTDSTSQLLLALAYSPSHKMTIDFGVAKGLNTASPDLSLFTGIVLPLAKLW